eukprot:1660037-Pyramimonas_sp.AAC.1
MHHHWHEAVQLRAVRAEARQLFARSSAAMTVTTPVSQNEFPSFVRASISSSAAAASLTSTLV